MIIGGSRGIGKAIALRLAKSKFDISLTYHKNHEGASAVKKEIASIGRTCELLCFDVSNYRQTKAALGKKANSNPPDVLVYNAGITRDNLLMWMTEKEWNSVIDTNLNGFYNVMSAVLFSMLSRQNGRIVVVASTAGLTGQAGQVNYSASKAGLIGAAKALAREVGKKNIFVNVVAPGFVESDMTKDLPQDKILPLIPLQRFGHADEVASIVNYLCCEKHIYIHGQVIGVNGGLVT